MITGSAAPGLRGATIAALRYALAVLDAADAAGGNEQQCGPVTFALPPGVDAGVFAHSLACLAIAAQRATIRLRSIADPSEPEITDHTEQNRIVRTLLQAQIEMAEIAAALDATAADVAAARLPKGDRSAA